MHTRTTSRRWTAVTAVALLVCSAIPGCRKSSTNDNEDTSAVSVQAEHPTVGPISEDIPADAILAPLAQAALAPKISAPIRAEYVQRGAHVKKGQLLLTLEDRDLQGNAADSRGAVTSAQAAYTTATQATIPEDVQKAQLDVDQTKANLEVANRTAEERKRLLAQGAIAGRDIDTAIAAAVQAQVTYDNAVKHLQSVEKTTRHTDAQSAQGQLNSAQGRLMSAEAQVSYASLRSPIDGVVTDRPLFPGETAAAGTPVITVMDTSSLLAKLHIAQASAQKLTSATRPTSPSPASTIRNPQPSRSSVPRSTPARPPSRSGSSSQTPRTAIKVGTPVHATLHGATIPNAMQVPADAILPGEDGGTNVLVVGADGTATKARRQTRHPHSREGPDPRRHHTRRHGHHRRRLRSRRRHQGEDRRQGRR